MSVIHPTAVVQPGATIGEDVTIGPYCVIGSNVVIKDGVKLLSHVCIAGDTHIGERCVIYPFASIGHPPQDLKFKGERSTLRIGDDNVIREHVTMNPGTEGGGLETSIGNNGFFMVGCHIAHDCVVGDYVIMANNATIAGHVQVGDHAVIGGLAAVHQFVHIGEHAMIGGMSAVEQDVIPFGTVTGERASLSGLNLIGMKRRGFSRDTIHQMRNSYKALFSADDHDLATLQSRASKLLEDCDDAHVQSMVRFLLRDSKRSFCMP